MSGTFVQADSRNLPLVNVDMVLSYLSGRDVYMAPEMRGVKEARSGRQTYGDAAIGYVAVSRDSGVCIVQAKICPEHRVTSSQYVVEASIAEAEGVIQNVTCFGCKASQGGCKHAVAFILWLQRRTDEPSPTSTVCYWKKSLLASSVGKTAKPVKLTDFGSPPEPIPDDASFLNKVLAAGNYSTSMLHRQFFERPLVEQLSLHYLLAQQIFDAIVSQILLPETCAAAEKATRGQADNPLWHELRYGRITASKVYEAAHCQTPSGSLVNSIIGLLKVRDTKAMERGRALEDPVIKLVASQLRLKWWKTGIFVNAAFPWLGASPDALTEDYVLEVKCPSKESTKRNYIGADGRVAAKFYAQIQTQMLLCDRRKGIFCVAEPDFETSSKVTLNVVEFDKSFVDVLLHKAYTFWNGFVRPRLQKN